MKKTLVVALVLLVCALVLGVSGGLLLAGESSVSAGGTPVLSGAGQSPVVWFDCPDANPDCRPGNP